MTQRLAPLPHAIARFAKTAHARIDVLGFRMPQASLAVRDIKALPYGATV
jgi:hypothetical protein